MFSMSRLLSLISFLALLVSSSLADTPATISGTVFGPVGTRLPGALITLTHKMSGEVMSITAGQHGVYRATGLPAGDYDISASLEGFRTEELGDIGVSAGTHRTVDFVLSMAFVLEEAVTVIGEAPMDSVEAGAIRETSARDAGEALAERAGIWKVRKGGIANDVVIRGFQSRNLNVLIDGQRVYGACPNRMDPAAFHVDFAEVDRIEVGKGPFDVKNQGSVGGAINIVTRKPARDLHGSFNIGVGSYEFVNPSGVLSYGAARYSALAGYSFRRSKAYRDGSGRRFTELANYKAEAVEGNAFEAGTVWGKLGWVPRDDHQIQFSYTRQDGGQVYYPYLRMDAVYDDANRLGLRYDAGKEAGPWQALSVQVYHTRVDHWMTDEHRVSSSPAPRAYSMGTLAKTRTTGLKAEADIRGVTLGAEIFERFWGATTELAGMQYRPQYSLPDATIRTIGVYTEYDRPLTRRLALSAGARLDRSTSRADEVKANTDLYFAYHGTRSIESADTFPSGKVRLQFEAVEGLTIAGGIGHVVGVPEHSERYFALKRMGADWVGNPELSPSRNTGLDLSVNLERSGLFVGGHLFTNRVEDYVAVVNQPRVNAVAGVMQTHARSYQNVDATLWGGELNAVASLTERLFLSGDFSYVRGIRTVSAGGGASEDLAEIPPARFRVDLRFDDGRLFFLLEGLFSTEQTRIDASLGEEPTPGYAVANCRVGFRKDAWSLTAGVANILDKSYFEHLSFQRDPFRSGTRVTEPGRNLFLNLIYRF